MEVSRVEEGWRLVGLKRMWRLVGLKRVLWLVGVEEGMVVNHFIILFSYLFIKYFYYIPVQSYYTRLFCAIIHISHDLQSHGTGICIIAQNKLVQ